MVAVVEPQSLGKVMRWQKRKHGSLRYQPTIGQIILSPLMYFYTLELILISGHKLIAQEDHIAIATGRNLVKCPMVRRKPSIKAGLA